MIDGQPLSRVSKVRDLGVKFDDKFSFTNYIDDVYNTTEHLEHLDSLSVQRLILKSPALLYI